MATNASLATSPSEAFGFEPEIRATRGLWGDAWRRLRKNKFALAGMAVLTGMVLLAFVGAYVGPTGRYAPNDQIYEHEKNAGPSTEHWFGTDQLSRDTFARVLEGVRVSIFIGFGTQAVVVAIGILVGAGAALGGKVSDNLLMRFTDIVLSFPDILLILLVRAILIDRDIPIITNSIVLIILAISFISWTTIARLVRGQMLSLAERDFVTAARSMGASRMSIVFKHMLPNTLGPVIVAVTFGIPVAIFAEAALGFIGLGVPPPTASLGTLVSTGYSIIQRNTWAVVFPATAVAMLMLSFTFIGDGLRDALDPRTR